MAKKVLRGAALAEHKARKRREEAGEPKIITGNSLLNGPSPGSVARDSRPPARVGIVHSVKEGVAYIREPGTADMVWDCPVVAVEAPSRLDAELAQLLDQGVILEPEDTDAEHLA
ncbi:hypothetical protein ACIRRH_26215 [Kitasatospora sp. NPDC101235]|uniref:hypothetical protein n=1 Tax=Kitasatospora sp. NPDC101235 TaxID=3364101 RepID=UPI0038253E62